MQPNRRPRPSWHYILFLSLIGFISGVYGIATLDIQERHQRYEAETVKQLAQMDAVSDTATKRARKEYGR